MPDPVRRLLQRASWQAEKLFKARGWLRTMVWVTEAQDGRRQMFETACEAERAELSDAQGLAALCADLRTDFAADGVIRYGVAFPASATTLLWPSALHLDIERRAHEVIALEAHAADAHLRAHRASVPRLAALGPIELAPVARFGSLITK
jgi:hypothetical protein